MKSDRLDTFTQYYSYSPAWWYMLGIQGNWEVSDNYHRGASMSKWTILREKEREYERNTAT